MEGDFTWVDDCTVQHADDVLQGYTPETYRIL